MKKPDQGEFFREVTLRICGSLEIEEALTSTFDYFARFMPADSMGLHYVDKDRRRIFPVALVARAGFTSMWDDAAEVPLDDEFMDLVRAKQEGEPSVGIYNRPEDLPPPVKRGFPNVVGCSVIALSLGIRGEPVGAIAVFADGHDRFTDAHAELLERVKEPMALAMSNARRHLELARMRDLLAEDNRALSADIERLSGTEVIGADFGLRDVMEMVRRVAGTNSPALLLGETGAGKEVIANAIHMASSRRDGPLIRMQCGAVPVTLLDSELFGHEKGAFTGAVEKKRGRFERADGGTLFLDEIGELSPDAQVKLLRVLQEKQFERVGGSVTHTVDVRVIAATHRDLDLMVHEGTFREDLWYRLNVVPIRIPPLRLRRDDIPSLVQYFVERKAREMNLTSTPRVSRDAMRRLRAYDWPGNVRELQNVVERALILSHGSRLVVPALAAGARGPAAAPPRREIPRTMDEAISDHLRMVLDHTDGQIAGPGGAAEVLDMNPSTLRFRMKKLGVSLSRPRRSLT